MPDIADPLIQGMMAGLRFKEVFQRAKQQREELDLRKQALADARAQRERQDQLHELTLRRQGLQDRLEMATNPALEDVTGSGSRTVTAAVPPEMQSPVGLGKTFSMEAPVENPIEYEGRQYAVRGPQERFNEKLQMETALAGAKRKEAQADWVPFETPGGQRFNLPPQSVGGAQRAFYPPIRPTPPAKPTPETPAEANTRRHNEWIATGQKPEGPAYLSYRLTGKLPAPEKQRTGRSAPIASPVQFRTVENSKNTRLLQATSRANKRIQDGEDESSVYSDLADEKQQIQDMYENEVAALGGSPVRFQYPRPGDSTGKVKMRAPDGTVTDVSPELVDHYESLGAKRI